MSEVAAGGVKLAVCVAALAASAACATKQEYAGFAQAGSSYASAVDRLLIASRETALDATSNRLLQDDALSNITLAQYNALSEPDRMRLRVIEDLRLHADLLGKYFRAMPRLTESKAPNDVKAALRGAVDGLNSVSKGLRESHLLTSEARSALGGIGELVVSAKLRGALREELQAHQATLRRELVLQEHLLRALADAIAHDLQITAQIREQRAVISPILDPKPISNADQWIRARRTVLLADGEVAELQNASRAAADMREAFEDLVSGRLTMGRLTGVIAELEGITSIAEHLMSHDK